MRPSQLPPISSSPPQPPKKTAKEEAIAWAKAIGAALLIWIVLKSFLIEAFRIPSASMENTLLIGDFLFEKAAQPAWAEQDDWQAEFALD